MVEVARSGTEDHVSLALALHELVDFAKDNQGEHVVSILFTTRVV